MNEKSNPKNGESFLTFAAPGELNELSRVGQSEKNAFFNNGQSKGSMKSPDIIVEDEGTPLSAQHMQNNKKRNNLLGDKQEENISKRINHGVKLLYSILNFISD